VSGIKIGHLASRAGVGVDTVRFYEKRGLLAEPERTTSGYRTYDPATVVRLRFIVRAKELGFTLREIGALLALRGEGDSCADVRELAARKIEEIDHRIQSLEQIRAALAHLASRCEERATPGDCALLEALQEIEGEAG
jgi:Hg(II)-responsive transcriptional regulator